MRPKQIYATDDIRGKESRKGTFTTLQLMRQSGYQHKQKDDVYRIQKRTYTHAKTNIINRLRY